MTSGFAFQVIAASGSALYRVRLNVVHRRSNLDANQMQKKYSDWREAVDGRLHQVYCITIDDVGFSEDYLIGFWRSNEMPFNFVDWLANKFDLDPMPSHAPSAKHDN